MQRLLAIVWLAAMVTAGCSDDRSLPEFDLNGIWMRQSITSPAGIDVPSIDVPSEAFGFEFREGRGRLIRTGVSEDSLEFGRWSLKTKLERRGDKYTLKIAEEGDVFPFEFVPLNANGFSMVALTDDVMLKGTKEVYARTNRSALERRFNPIEEVAEAREP